MDFADKVIVISGAASGIGLALAQALHKRGGQVILADIEAEAAQAAAAQLGAGAVGKALDVTKMASWQGLAEDVYQHYGRVDMLVNNAGVGGEKTLLESDEEDMDWIIDVNFKAVWRGIKVFGNRMRAQETPSIICNTASENSFGYVYKGMSVYNATKHAVLGLSDTLRHELPPHMKVCCLFPGLVKSRIYDAQRNGPKGALPDAQKAFRKNFNELGMDASDAAEIFINGLENEDFIIPSHPHAINFARRRWEEISAAFDKYAPYTAASEKYDVKTLIEGFLESQKSTDKDAG